jgi:hypothetical protein
MNRLVSLSMSGKALTKNYRRPKHAFAPRYTAAEVALLAGGPRARP